MNLLLRYLFMIRGIAMSGLALGLAIMHGVFELRVPVFAVTSAILTLGMFSLVSWRSLRKRADITDAQLTAQLIADMLALAVVVYFTGGSVNPFISLFIIPVIFAAAGMQIRNAVFIALLAFGIYTLLMFFNRPLVDAHDHSAATRLHLWGMWYGFALSAALVALFVARMGMSLRRRDRALADARAQSLRADKAIALGTLAAGTAHELGTPLSTMAVICKDLREQGNADPGHREDLDILGEQIDRCKSILAQMASDAGALQSEVVRTSSLDVYLELLIAEWRESRSAIVLEVEKRGEQPELVVAIDRNLSQALMNVLHNAADAARSTVKVILDWNSDYLHIEIRDDGAGVATAVRPQLGDARISTKDDGMGIGLLLATTTIKRLNGTLSYQPIDDGGTLVCIELPVDKLLASENPATVHE